MEPVPSAAEQYDKALRGRPSYLAPGSTTVAPGYSPPVPAQAAAAPPEIDVQIPRRMAAPQQPPVVMEQPYRPSSSAAGGPQPLTETPPPAREGEPYPTMTKDDFNAMASDPAEWEKLNPGLSAGSYGGTGQVATPERTWDGAPTFDQQRDAAIKAAGIKTGMDQATFDWLRARGDLSPEQIVALKRQYPHLK